MDVILTGFKPVQLTPPKPQAEVLDYFSWVIAAHQCNAEQVRDQAAAQAIFAEVRAKVWNYGVSPEQIAARQLNALPETLRGSERGGPSLPALMSFADGPKGSGLGLKMRHFKDVARQVFEQAYADAPPPPSTLIHVTCAGYVSPSAAQEFLGGQGWHETGVTHSYHMGCYGAFPPVKMACGYLSSTHHSPQGFAERQIDVVHTEFLSLHGDYSTVEPGPLVNMTLFADGFIKYSALRREQLQGRHGLQVLAQYEQLLPDSQDEMTWTPTAQLFEMYLSKAVPLKIKQNIKAFVTELCRRSGIDFAAGRERLFFAIHPGGPRILDHIQEELGIRDDQMQWSRAVLKELGNMSSATVPHIWARMLEDLPAGSRIVSMAFGPGLTATGLVLQKV